MSLAVLYSRALSGMDAAQVTVEVHLANGLPSPLLDRIDIQIEVPAVPQKALLNQADGETSGVIQQRVEAARQRQLMRQGKPNAQLTVTESTNCVRWMRRVPRCYSKSSPA